MRSPGNRVEMLGKNQPSVGCCFLCDKNVEPNATSLKAKLNGFKTGYTYLDVLTKLMQKEKLQELLLEKDADFSNRRLCAQCVKHMEGLFRLQLDLRLKKNKVIDIFKNTLLTRDETVEQQMTKVNFVTSPKSRNGFTSSNENGTKGLTENKNFVNEYAGPTLNGNAGPMIEIDDARVDVLPDNFNDSQTSIGITKKDETLENINTTHEEVNNGDKGMTVISEREETKLKKSVRVNQTVNEQNEEQSGKKTKEGAATKKKRSLIVTEQEPPEKKRKSNTREVTLAKKRKTSFSRIEIPEKKTMLSNVKVVDRKTTEKTEKTKESKKKTNSSDTYIVEMLLKKSKNKFLVKWEGYPVQDATWENRSSLPDFVLAVNFSYFLSFFMFYFSSMRKISED